MAYGDQGYRFRGEGFRDEPDFRADTGSTPTFQPGYGATDYTATSPAETSAPTRRVVTSAELDDVFDDPEHGDPGMDRMGVHMVWELLLLIATVGMAVYFRQTHHAGVAGDSLRHLLLDAAALGFLAIGIGLSLRASVVNLAVGPIAAAAALFVASHTDRGLIPTAGVTLLLAGGVGVAIALLVVVLHVPGWAASLGAALTVVIWINKHVAVARMTASYHPAGQAFYWYGGFAALALLGGILGLVRPIRRGVGRFRPVGDPAARRGALAGVMAFVAIVGSCLLAGLGGLLTALSSTTVTPSDGFLGTGLALGAALAAGTSAFGRRGGVLGTVLSVTLITLVMHYSDAARLSISPYAIAAVAVGVGLLATRLVESFGRPPVDRKAGQVAEVDSGGWDAGTRTTDIRAAEAGSAGWTGTRQSGWTSQLPAQSTDDTWGGASDDRWGVK
jgi:ribose/xylose/arabinose/galactoside ABC-type transport system permease subunit